MGTTRRIFANRGVTMAKFQNIANLKCVEIFFGKQDIASVFSMMI